LYSFLLQAEEAPGPNSSDLIWNRNSDFLTFSIVPNLPRALTFISVIYIVAELMNYDATAARIIAITIIVIIATTIIVIDVK
jgi:hypothetical protein